MSIIKTDTFTANETQTSEGFIYGTVEVTIRYETRRVDAYKDRDGLITARGLVGRYSTGTKAWPATVSQMISPRTNQIWETVFFGRDDRHGKFQKAHGLHFA